MERLRVENLLPGEDATDPNEERARLHQGETVRDVRLHDYGELYRVPGMYERILCLELGYGSPQKVCRLLRETLEEEAVDPGSLRVLDFGAGNGLAGECLRRGLGCGALVGVDILPEARAAAQRDRPGLYDDYYTMDLFRLRDEDRSTLERWKFNALVTVGALAFGDIPAQAFFNAFDFLEEGAWVAFNIRGDFLSGRDKSGFRKIIHDLTGQRLRILRKRRLLHRYTLSGKPMYYQALVGRKEVIPPR
jgi:hypothetical protein